MNEGENDMKRFFKFIAIFVMMAVLVGTVNSTVVEAAQARTILRYESSNYSPSGRVRAFVALVVQDSNGTIIDYAVELLVGTTGVSDIEVLASGITGNSTMVYVHVQYAYGGKTKSEMIYIYM